MRLFSFLIALVAGLGASAGPATEEETPSAPSREDSALPPGVVARIDGRPVFLQDYERYLVFTVGSGLLRDYVDHVLIEEEAQRLGVSVPYEAVERETERELQRDVRRFGGREAYAAALRERGSSYEEKVKRVRREALRRLTLDRCLEKSRQVTPAEADREPTPLEREAYLGELRRKGDVQTISSGRSGEPPREDPEPPRP